MSEPERVELVAFLGAKQEAGEIIPETGGVRKIRWGLHSMGKREACVQSEAEVSDSDWASHWNRKVIVVTYLQTCRKSSTTTRLLR